MKSLAPIVLFVYNRPNHTKRTIEALCANHLASESELFIYSDAPKNEGAKADVESVRIYIRNVTGFKKVNIIERTQNFGLVKSIEEGVTEIVKRFGKIIVLEDDLITHFQFLDFLNQALNIYQNDTNVFALTGYSLIPCKETKSSNTSYFLKIPSTWGWATWENKWIFYNTNVADSEELNYNVKLKKMFNYDNSYNYYKMLANRDGGKVKSWGILWYWNIFKRNGLTLFPTETLVDQIGWDGSGQNASNYAIHDEKLKQTTYEFIFPKLVVETDEFRAKIVHILRYRKLNILIKFIKQKFKIIYDSAS